MSPEGRPSPHAVRTVAVIGTGVIGGGWAAHFLRMGYDVVAWDPGPDAAVRLTRLLDDGLAVARAARAESGRQPRPPAVRRQPRGRLSRRPTSSRSRPRRCCRPRSALLAAIDRATRPGIVVGSSTSGFLMSAMAVDCATPESLRRRAPVQPAVPHPARRGRGRPRHRSRDRGVGRGVLHFGGQGLPDHGTGGARLCRQPAPGSTLARGAAHGRLRAGHRPADRRLHRRTAPACAGR